MSQISKLLQGNGDNLEIPPLRVKARVPMNALKSLECEPSDVELSNELPDRMEDLSSHVNEIGFMTPEIVKSEHPNSKKQVASELAANMGIVATPEQMELLAELFPKSKSLLKVGLLSQIVQQSLPAILGKIGLASEFISSNEIETNEVFLKNKKRKRRYSKRA